MPTKKASVFRGVTPSIHGIEGIFSGFEYELRNYNRGHILRPYNKQPFDVFSESSFGILFVCLHTVVNCTWSCCQICFPNNFNLIWNFFRSPVFYMFKYTRGIKTRDNKPTLVILIVPPVEKRFKRLASGINGPVELRSKVIQPSFI